MRLSTFLRNLADPPRLREFLRQARSPDLKLALKLCAPGVVVALALRIWLLCAMPAAFIHNDTASIIRTPERLLGSAALEIESKKTFLAPVLYSIPAVLRVPVLHFIAPVQHFFGVLTVLAAGLLAFGWFSAWRVWIPPLTLLVAINPVLLWYEHVALPESLAVFGAVATALAGTFFYHQPNRYTLALLFAALLFVAGARPEGWLFAIFGLALVTRRYWGDWWRLRVGVAACAVWSLVLLSITRTGQSGLLLYASLIHWSPDHLALSPGIAEALRPVQARAIREWQAPYAPKLVSIRKDIQQAMVAHLAAQGVADDRAAIRVDSLCKRAALEIAVRNFWRLPKLALQKFIIAHRELPAPGFSRYTVDGQLSVLFDKDRPAPPEVHRLLWGVTFASREEARAFLEARYGIPSGMLLTSFLKQFVGATLLPILPINLPGSTAPRVPIVGLPWLYASAFVGAVCLALRDRSLLGFHQLWLLFLVSLFIILMVTANIRARFRFLFEPFWTIYLFALLDTAPALLRRVRNRPA